eukprot:jgi/Botrbrau1/15505/Bobra.43_2s0122.1
MQGISGSGRLKGSVGPIYVGILLLVAAMVHGASKTSCRNAQGKAVDWWIMLKKPKGSAYAYVDSTMASPAFQIVTDANLTKTSGNPLAETVGKIYSKSVWHVTYNDQLWNRTAPKFPPVQRSRPTSVDTPKVMVKHASSWAQVYWDLMRMADFG